MFSLKRDPVAVLCCRLPLSVTRCCSLLLEDQVAPSGRCHSGDFGATGIVDTRLVVVPDGVDFDPARDLRC